ncbi:MAG: hypothetical protein J3K34DRAFT_436523 [Monoraphidium minutum]|nr:MAG: hypothetical protein J3K34DRAFT_436523 [Monoraphidium minutum]
MVDQGPHSRRRWGMGAGGRAGLEIAQREGKRLHSRVNRHCGGALHFCRNEKAGGAGVVLQGQQGAQKGRANMKDSRSHCRRSAALRASDTATACVLAAAAASASPTAASRHSTLAAASAAACILAKAAASMARTTASRCSTSTAALVATCILASASASMARAAASRRSTSASAAAAAWIMSAAAACASHAARSASRLPASALCAAASRASAAATRASAAAVTWEWRRRVQRGRARWLARRHEGRLERHASGCNDCHGCMHAVSCLISLQLIRRRLWGCAGGSRILCVFKTP